MIAVLIIAYNEEEYIRQAIQQWNGLVDKVLVLVSDKPWSGENIKNNTFELARQENTQVVKGYWKTEEQQRNYGLAMLYDYDYVIINDPDEFYIEEDRNTIIEFCQDPKDELDGGRFKGAIVREMITYWKTPEFVFDPPDQHQPYIAVDPKEIQFGIHRTPRQINKVDNLARRGVIDVVCHHLSWVHSDKKVKEKIDSFSHSGEIPPNWYDDVWLSWEKGDDTMIRPYGEEKSIVVEGFLPTELKHLIFS